SQLRRQRQMCIRDSLIADYSLITSPSNMLFLLINFKSDKNFSNLSVRKSSSLFASPSRLITSDTVSYTHL
ncbi:hypothetical protein KQJ29_39170, partial [Enterococcus sp. S181_ASV_20]|nr:hypothetical protein [Enterococcus sp. S181_ASV_20]